MQHVKKIAARLKNGYLVWTYLCKFHIRLHNRLHLCKTHRIILVHTSPRASPTQCGNSAPLCRLHRPDNSRSHPGLSACTAASRHTAPPRICRGSSPRTWHWRSTHQHLALRARRALWGAEETSRDAGRVRGARGRRLLRVGLSAGSGGDRGADHLGGTCAEWPKVHQVAWLSAMNNFVLHMACPRQFPYSGVVVLFASQAPF